MLRITGVALCETTVLNRCGVVASCETILLIALCETTVFGRCGVV